MLSPMGAVLSCLVVGCGYVGTRFARQSVGRRPVLAIVRSGPSATDLQAAGINTMRLDLDADEPELQPSLATAASGAAVVYLVPPPDHGATDPRLERFLLQLGAAVPAVFVYVSTTGVYGDTGGALVDEHTPVAPGNDRARRRVAAESVGAGVVRGTRRALRGAARAGHLRTASAAARAARARRTRACGRKTRAPATGSTSTTSPRASRRRSTSPTAQGALQRDRRRPLEHDRVPAGNGGRGGAAAAQPDRQGRGRPAHLARHALVPARIAPRRQSTHARRNSACACAIRACRRASSRASPKCAWRRPQP